MADINELMVRLSAAEKGKSIGAGETFDHAGRSWTKTMKGDVIPSDRHWGALTNEPMIINRDGADNQFRGTGEPFGTSDAKFDIGPGYKSRP